MTKHRRIFARYARTLKTFSLAAAAGLMLVGAGLFTSCSNLGGDYGGEKLQTAAPAVQPSDSQVLGDLCASVAIQNLPSIAGGDSGMSKSAFPKITDVTSDASYSFSATLTLKGEAAPKYSAEGTYDSGSGNYSFTFAGAKSSEAQDYVLTVFLYHSSGASLAKNLVASGEQSVTVAADAGLFSADVSLAPNVDDAAPKGTIALPIKFSDTSVTTSVTVQLIDKNNDDVAATCLEGGSTVTLDGSGVGEIKSSTGGLPSGTYTLLMTFYQNGLQVASRTESLNIYPTLETNVWWTNSDTAVAQLAITKFDQTEFWVKGEGGDFYSNKYTAYTGAGLDTNNGSFAFPLKNVQEAVRRIKEGGDATTQYIVYIDGKVTCDPNPTDSSIVYMDKSRKILFKGWTGPDTDIIDVNKNWEHFIYMPRQQLQRKTLALQTRQAAQAVTAARLGLTLPRMARL